MDGRYRIYDGLEDGGEVPARYAAFAARRRLVMLGLTVAFILTLVLTPLFGPVDIPAQEVLRCLFTFDWSSGDGRIVWNVRMVRIIGGMLAGAGLAVSGVVMQCILRNPLASPYTLGLSNAAAFGAAFSIVFLSAGSMASSSIAVDNPFATVSCAFIFSMAAVGIILALTRVTRVTPETMVLGGIAISAMFSAMLSFTQYVATDSQLANIVSWTFGDMGRATWSWDMFVFAALVPVAAYFLMRRWDYNALDAGEETAKGLGVNVEMERIIGLILASLLCSIIVSFFGVIAFVGLLGPHIARMLVGADHRHLIPASMMLGAMIMIISDLVGRTVLQPEMLPAGIITSMLGGPLFIYLLVRRYRR